MYNDQAEYCSDPDHSYACTIVSHVSLISSLLLEPSLLATAIRLDS